MPGLRLSGDERSEHVSLLVMQGTAVINRTSSTTYKCFLESYNLRSYALPLRNRYGPFL
jgi:hypothetical protein